MSDRDSGAVASRVEASRAKTSTAMVRAPAEAASVASIRSSVTTVTPRGSRASRIRRPSSSSPPRGAAE
ncbi:MAG TPA: hypothetical protein PLB02_13120, partial [Thermoanaerobaculia bacterium]|nr:hypothetical protein [Thermoanaerobaculia bacterium]